MSGSYTGKRQPLKLEGPANRSLCLPNFNSSLDNMRRSVLKLLPRLQGQQLTQAQRFLSAQAAPAPVDDQTDAPVNQKDGKVLHPSLLNSNMLKTQYAVRGELYLKAEQLKNAGKEIIFTNGENGYHLKRCKGDAHAALEGAWAPAAPTLPHAITFIGANGPTNPTLACPLCSFVSPVGNPHNLGALPLTFTRQVRFSRRCAACICSVQPAPCTLQHVLPKCMHV